VRSFYFFPLGLVFILGLFLFLIVLFVLVQVQIISYAYERIGISAGAIFLLLLSSLLGSAINIPITRVPSGPRYTEQFVDVFGRRFVLPAFEVGQETIIAINVGGAIIPVCIAFYLLISTPGLFLRSLLGTAIVSFVAQRLARPVPGIGIAIPLFIPPLVAAATGLILAPSHAAAVAYIAGTLGCLIGADLLNLHHLAGLGAPIASIGGAGTFDGIFFTGIVAVLLT
jgi:uncharacterized membrane protein